MSEVKKPDPIAAFILGQLSGEDARTHQDLARAYAETRRTPKDPKDLWRRYLVAVRQQVLHLAREGRVEIVRNGEVVDPEDFRGIVRVRRAKKK